jgi:hypothetical protein
MFFDIVDGFGRSDSPPAVVSGAASDAPTGAGEIVGEEFTAGQTVDRDGLQITAEPLRKVNQQYGDPLACSKVTYRNAADGQASFNVIDWKIQDPAGVQSSASWRRTVACTPGSSPAAEPCRATCAPPAPAHPATTSSSTSRS